MEPSPVESADVELAEQRFRLRSIVAMTLFGLFHALGAATVAAASALVFSYQHALTPLDIFVFLPLTLLSLLHGASVVLVLHRRRWARVAVLVLLAIDLVCVLGCVSMFGLCVVGWFAAVGIHSHA